MPYIRGGSLGARLRERGRLPLDEVVALVREIALGLAHAHAHRVLHCDIKPENVLVDGGHPYVMDFGIARKLHTEANEWTGVRRELDFSAGTPAYVSPEQAAGDWLLDERSDVYSLACVVYEMLTGRVAFAGDNTQEIVSLRFREPPPPLREFTPEVPYRVALAIEHAMALDPDRRPASATAFAHELGVAAQSASSLVTKISLASSRARRWARRRPARAIRTGGFARMLDTLRQDVTYGFRQRLRAPALTAIAVCTLAAGIGLATTVFALVDGVLLRPLPFPQQDRLVALEGRDSAGNEISRVSASDWFDWRAQTRALSGTAIYSSGRTSVVANDQAMRSEVATVSPEFFRVMGARFRSGRGFDSAESSRGRGGAVVSEEFWQRVFGGVRDSARTLLLNGYPMPIIGVLARGQAFPADVEVWASYTHRQVGGAARNNINWYVVGRLAPNVGIDQATAELTRVARRVHDSDPVDLYGWGVTVLPLREQLSRNVASLLELLAGAVATVMLIACANLASANLAQGAQRLREMAVRSALGASRYRLVRQVLVENTVLAAVGGAAGIGVAWVLLRTAAVTQGAKLPHITDIGMNTSVLAAAAVLALAAGVLTGVLPALQASRAAPNDVLGGSARGTALGGRTMPGRVLVAAEIAMALVLVTGAGLFVQSFRAVLAQPLGFTTQHIAVAEVALSGPRYRTDSIAKLSYWDNLLRSLRTAPGVRAASLANWVPLVFGGTGFVEIEGSAVPNAGAGYRVVSDGYFDAIQMTRLAGRDFGDADGATTTRVAVINKAMADKYWPGQSPLGRRVRATSMEPGPNGQPSPWITVIGVVNDVRHFGYETEPMPEMFVYYRQMPAWRLAGMSAVVRGAGSDGALLATVRSVIKAQDPTIPTDISLLDDAARRNTASRRFTMSVLSLFGMASLVLAGIGVYGVLSFSVAQRTREMAVRSALGADRGNIIRLVLGNAGVVVGAGIALGVAAVYAGGRFVESMLFDVKAGDPVVVAVAVIMIVIVGALAAAVPARRATRTDPMTVLRNDG